MSEFASAQVYQRGNNYEVSHGNDAQLFPEFYDREVVDEQASAKEGRPIHKTIPYCKIAFPGDRTKVIDEPVIFESVPGGKPAHSQRFPRQWEAYQNKHEQVSVGTSLLEWAPLPRAEALDLKGQKIHTVEQLAAIPDTGLTWLGARLWRDKAIAWLAQASGGAAVMKLQTENATLRGDVEMLKQQIKDLASMRTPDETNRGPDLPKNNTEGE